MADVFSTTKRSEVMSKIKGKDTQLEIKTRKWLFAHGFRYRKNGHRLPGKPDIVLPKYKSVVFVNGCFWHGHEGCRLFRIPKTNTPFWEEKIHQTQSRDKAVISELIKAGWNVHVLWECELKSSFISTMLQLESELRRHLLLID